LRGVLSRLLAKFVRACFVSSSAAYPLRLSIFHFTNDDDDDDVSL
jgi:hypothetical protein